MKFDPARTLKTFFIFSASLSLAACGGGRQSAVSTYTVGGTVNGLVGTVVLGNGGDELSIAANGAFHFTHPVARGAAYAVTVKMHPSFQAQDCTVTNGSGAIGTGYGLSEKMRVGMPSLS